MSISSHQRAVHDLAPPIHEQPTDVRGIGDREREGIVISVRNVDGTSVITSRYADAIWWLTGAPTNTKKSCTKLDFTTIPPPFREVAKAIMYRFMRRGREGQTRPGVGMLTKTLWNMKPFFEHLLSRGIFYLADVTPNICSGYVHVCKNVCASSPSPLSPTSSQRSISTVTLSKRFFAVEAIHELSQYTDDPMPEHPWPDSSADHLSENKKVKLFYETKTPLIPDEIFSALFQNAWNTIQNADWLLSLRDEIEKAEEKFKHHSKPAFQEKRTQVLRELGWNNGYGEFKDALLNIRTGCYIVIASLSGCRNHELAYVQSKAYFSTVGNDGERYWWMRSKSVKSKVGDTHWMIPEAAVKALKIMDRWAIPYQIRLQQEIENYRSTNPQDPRISEAQEHLGAVFVGMDKAKGNQVRTISASSWGPPLRAFLKNCGLEWNLNSHQFRRKFANYAARSQFGDLRYLREHFKHWSMDMTLGYAMNESQEMSLYQEIGSELDEIKDSLVAEWLDTRQPLAGGYGKKIMSWRTREENITFFKSHAHMVRSIAQSTAIRSNGHAWCSADDNQCVGNETERTRCGDGCENAVIGKRHAPIYQGLYDQLKRLEDCRDIGEAGRTRVQRDLSRCKEVLQSLGITLEERRA